MSTVLLAPTGDTDITRDGEHLASIVRERVTGRTNRMGWRWTVVTPDGDVVIRFHGRATAVAFVLNGKGPWVRCPRMTDGGHGDLARRLGTVCPECGGLGFVATASL